MNSQQLIDSRSGAAIPTPSATDNALNDLCFNNALLLLSNKLLKQISSVVNKHAEVIGSNGIVINFRDTGYSNENGGYRPVEISLSKGADNQYTVLYITDFSYCGHYFPELERDLDFDFGN